MSAMRSREAAALGALAVILAITALWWALALWPLPGDAPAWLARTRVVCFGSAADGLPSTAGWMALIGQPLYMMLTLWLIAGQAVLGGVRALARSRGGRAALNGSGLLLAAGLTAAGVRVASATATTLPPAPGATVRPADVPRLDRPAPPLALVDQEGRRVSLGQFHGRPVFLTFAYAHCQTVCPLVVQDVLRARERTPELHAAVLVVTLDPWRDTPDRLPAVAEQWRLGDAAQVLSGAVADVERALDDWHVARERNLRTGEVAHPAIVYLIDRNGRIAYVVNGGAETLAALARRL